MTADAVGGVWTYSLDLAAAFAHHGVSTILTILGPQPSEEQRREACAIAGLTLIETDLPLDWTCSDQREMSAAAAAVSALASEVDADIIHFNGTPLASESDYDAPVVAAHHSCLATWWATMKQGRPPQDWLWRIELTRRHLASADRVVVPSAAFAAQVSSLYCLAEPPKVVRNGRACMTAQPDIDSQAALFTAGRLWDDGKNIVALDRAAPFIDVPVLAAGPVVGPNGAAVSCSNLHLLGELSSGTIRDWLAARPIFVSTALYEPFGLAVLEAAQAGCALLLSDIPTFRELWDGAAFFVAARDEMALGRAASTLLETPTLRRSLEEAAYRRASAYDLDLSAQGLMALYRDLLSGQHLESAA
jgi:glycosyltransferase involved in cell wall biosynthesis